MVVQWCMVLAVHITLLKPACTESCAVCCLVTENLMTYTDLSDSNAKKVFVDFDR